jgi:hypothetical protein
MSPNVTLREALSDPQLLGEVLAGPSWQPWTTLLIASMGEALTDDERVLFKELTQRDREPLRRVEELVGVVGRRGGKSRAISVLATYIAALCSHPALVPGEVGVVLCVAADMEQASIVFSYIEAAFQQSPVLRQLIASRTARSLRLTNNIEIEVRSADFRRLRGPTYVAVVCDEVAFWMTGENSANPDDEIVAAIRPGLATTRGPLFVISSPYARRGVLWDLYRQHFGPYGDPLILVAQGSSRTFNPTLPQSVVDRAVERDPASAAAEYGAQFRTDVESFVRVETVYACIAPHIYERSPQADVTYYAFVDPSGGSVDSMALCVGHLDAGRQAVIIDVLREVTPPFSPEAVCEDFARTLHRYHITTLNGDRYAGVWPVEAFSRFGVNYEQSAKPKSDLYRDLLPLINSKRVELLDHVKLINQLCSLERRTARGGRDSIDHPPGGHDDLINAVAGLAAVQHEFGSYSLAGFQPDYHDTDRAADGQRLPNPRQGLVEAMHAYLALHGV